MVPMSVPGMSGLNHPEPAATSMGRSGGLRGETCGTPSRSVLSER